MSDMPVIEEKRIEDLRTLSDGNDDLLRELLDKYLQNTEKLLEECLSGLRTAENERVQRNLHTLKGSSLNLGLVRIGDRIVKLYEQTLNDDFDNLEPEISALVQLLDEVRQYRGSLD